jgi:hypothetical protein
MHEAADREQLGAGAGGPRAFAESLYREAMGDGPQSVAATGFSGFRSPVMLFQSSSIRGSDKS